MAKKIVKPKHTGTQSRNYIVGISVSKAERAIIRWLAKQQKLNVSQYLRSKVSVDGTADGQIVLPE
jgi:hypothetical protein